MKPFFSIIIPTFNRRDLLERAIESVLSQTFLNWELLISDDGSTDNTKELQLKYNANNIKWLWSNHFGVSRARNFAVNLAKADWIVFLDSDDFWLANKLNEQQKFIKQYPQNLIFQSNEIWVRNGVRVNAPKKHLKKQGDLFSQSLELCAITPSSVCIQKKLLVAFGGFDEKLQCCEDYDLWLRITAQYPVGLIEEPLLIRYAGHKGQLSQSFDSLDRFRCYSLCKLLLFESLQEQKIQLASQMLQKKSAIFLNGLKKRNKKTTCLEKLFAEFWLELAKPNAETKKKLLKNLAHELL